jgi:hypothetical protein
MEDIIKQEIEQIEAEIEKLEAIIDEKDKNWDFSRPFYEYQEYLSAERKRIIILSKRKRLIMPYELAELPDYGDVMSLEDFIGCVNVGGFIDYDGWGYYVKDNQASNVKILPSDVNHNSIRKDFDTIVWFNR